MVWFDEFEISSRGNITVEGDDDRDQELEIDFRSDSLEPVRVERDD